MKLYFTLKPEMLTGTLPGITFMPTISFRRAIQAIGWADWQRCRTHAKNRTLCAGNNENLSRINPSYRIYRQNQRRFRLYERPIKRPRKHYWISEREHYPLPKNSKITVQVISSQDWWKRTKKWPGWSVRISDKLGKQKGIIIFV